MIRREGVCALSRLVRPMWQMTIVGAVPSDQKRFLEQEACKPKWLFKFVKRWVIFLLLGQRQCLVEAVAPSVRRILWINLTAPSLGDSLMDLAARKFLSGRELHLLTSPKNAALYTDDPYFSKVMTEVGEAKSEHHRKSYELVILDSFSPRSLLPKVRVAWRGPVVGVYGFLNGFEVHRTLYAFARFSHLLQLQQGALQPRVTEIALGQRLQGEGLISALGEGPGPTLGIGIGGEWTFRTYGRWSDVIKALLNDVPSLSIVLLGSANGLEDAAHIEGEVLSKRLINLVGRTSLAESCSVLRACDAYLGADGGLWHMASACGLPTVALFADCQLFDETGKTISRASPDQVCTSLMAEHDVNEIPATKVVESTGSLLKNLSNALRDRQVLRSEIREVSG